MAHKAESKDYVLVEDEPNLKMVIPDIKTDTRERKLIAVDCEGVDLSRKGKLTVLALATQHKVYIFDVLKLGKSVFDDGLSEILEDKSVEKLMFDCRQDSDALWHQYNVKLAGSLDMQLLEIMYRRDNEPSKSTKRYPKRSRNVDDVENVYGYKKCLELYVKDDKLCMGKAEGTNLMSTSTGVWEVRPLKKVLIRYCCIDVKGLFKLYASLKREDRYLERLRVASARYLDRYRSLMKRYYDEYECNAYLHLDVIPDGSSLSFPHGNTKCVGCERLFPREEFSNIQLRHGEQKCRVCKEVKRELDIQENREAQWERAYRCAVEYNDRCEDSDLDDPEGYLF